MVDHDQKIWARKQIIDIGKYFIVNRTIKLPEPTACRGAGEYSL
jgi:hypothetical protein